MFLRAYFREIFPVLGGRILYFKIPFKYNCTSQVNPIPPRPRSAPKIKVRYINAVVMPSRLNGPVKRSCYISSNSKEAAAASQAAAFVKTSGADGASSRAPR
jgi:hypothetical protein